MYDSSGKVTLDESKMYGRPTTYQLIHPENVLFVDETGSNTNMKQDGYVGGELYVLPCDPTSEFGVCGATTDMHFSVLCFTNGLGVPIMCALILKSSKDISQIPLSWRIGIDIRKEAASGETNVEMFGANFGEGKVMPGGPVCTYNGIDIPCFIGCSPNASITSEMLAAMLETMDQRNVFDRTNGKQPFLLLDGHQSRIKLPFLRYINNEEHPWKVCLGVPYGTHIWQVGDSAQQNGAFKVALYKDKKEYLTFRDIDDQKFVATDIIPLVNSAWAKSFARVECSRKAILQRGFNPLNYVLLDRPELKKPELASDSTTITATTNGSTTVTDTTNTTVSASIVLSTTLSINKDGKTVSKYLDHLIVQASKNEGRKRKYEEQQKKKHDNDSKINLLKNMTKISSGKLCSNNCYVLNNDLLGVVERKEAEDQCKKDGLNKRESIQQHKEQDKFKLSYKKYASKQRLTNDNMRNLLRHVRKRDDSPVRTKKAEVMQQWLSKKHRLDDYLLTSNPADNVNTGFSGEAVENVELTSEFLKSRNMGSESEILSTFAENENFGDDQTPTVREI